MALTETLARAAKKNAVSAREKARLAEEELIAANRELDDAIRHQRPAGAVRAHQRTQVAEKAVAEAAHEMEVVEVLLDAAQGPAAGPREEPPQNGEARIKQG